MIVQKEIQQKEEHWQEVRNEQDPGRCSATTVCGFSILFIHTALMTTTLEERSRFLEYIRVVGDTVTARSAIHVAFLPSRCVTRTEASRTFRP